MRSCLAGSHARSVLQDGDFLLTVAGRPVSHFQAVEAAVAGPTSSEKDRLAGYKVVPSSILGVASSTSLAEAAEAASEVRSTPCNASCSMT